jgi:PEGA domain/Tetratricopeptide repeat
MKHAIRSFLLFLLTASFAVPVYAQNDPPSATEQARRHLKAGGVLYDLGYYKEAIEELDAAYKLAPLSAFFYNLGLAYRRVGNPSKAKEYFTRFIEEQKNGKEPPKEELLKDTEQQIIELDTLLAASEDQTLLSKEVALTKEEKKRGLKKLLDPKKGMLVVTSKQSPVRLILNGGAVAGGLTPYVDYLNPGKYVLEISADGYEPYVQEVIIDPKKPQVVVANLANKKALLTILTEQDSATVKIDGVILGKGSKVGPAEVEPGTRKLEVSQSGFKTYKRQISLDPGEKKDLEVSLKQQVFLFSPAFQYVIAGTSAATVITGGVFGLIAQLKTNEANDLIEENAVFDDALAEVIEQGEQAEKRQIAFLIAGGAGLVGSGAIYLISRKLSKPKEQTTSIDFMISPAASAMLRVSY